MLKQKRIIPNKIISIIVLFSFLISTCKGFTFTSPLQLPVAMPTYGTVTQEFISTTAPQPNKPFIYIIQDIHCNKEAQQNIAKIITQITKFQNTITKQSPITNNQIPNKKEVRNQKPEARMDYLVKPDNDKDMSFSRSSNTSTLVCIGVEGNFQKIDVSVLNNIKNKKIKQQIIEYFLNRGYLTGTELYLAENKNTIPAYGIEDRDIYVQNFNALHKSLNYEKTIMLEIIQKLQDMLNQAKPVVYPKKVRQLEYKKQVLSNLEYTRYIYNVGKRLGLKYQEVEKYIKIEKLKRSIDSQTLRLEAKNLINRIQNPEAGMDYPVKPDNDKDVSLSEPRSESRTSLLIRQSRARLPRSDAARNDDGLFAARNDKNKKYYQNLKELVQARNIEVQSEELNRYFKYLNIRIDNVKLLHEKQDLEYKVKRSLLKGFVQGREILYTEKYLRLLKKLVKNELTSKEFEKWKKGNKKFYRTITKLEKRLNNRQGLVAILEQETKKARVTMEEFYKLAEKRNEVLVAKMLQLINSKSEILNKSKILNSKFKTKNKMRLLRYARNDEKSGVIARNDNDEAISTLDTRYQIQDTNYTPALQYYNTTALNHNAVGIMIVGGFHTNGITKILRNRGIGYKVIIPNVQEIGNSKEVYERRLEEQARYLQNNQAPKKLKNSKFQDTITKQSPITNNQISNKKEYRSQKSEARSQKNKILNSKFKTENKMRLLRYARNDGNKQSLREGKADEAISTLDTRYQIPDTGQDALALMSGTLTGKPLIDAIINKNVSLDEVYEVAKGMGYKLLKRDKKLIAEIKTKLEQDSINLFEVVQLLAKVIVRPKERYVSFSGTTESIVEVKEANIRASIEKKERKVRQQLEELKEREYQQMHVEMLEKEVFQLGQRARQGREDATTQKEYEEQLKQVIAKERVLRKSLRRQSKEELKRILEDEEVEKGEVKDLEEEREQIKAKARRKAEKLARKVKKYIRRLRRQEAAQQAAEEERRKIEEQMGFDGEEFLSGGHDEDGKLFVLDTTEQKQVEQLRKLAGVHTIEQVYLDEGDQLKLRKIHLVKEEVPFHVQDLEYPLDEPVIYKKDDGWYVWIEHEKYNLKIKHPFYEGKANIHPYVISYLFSKFKHDPKYYLQRYEDGNFYLGPIRLRGGMWPGPPPPPRSSEQQAPPPPPTQHTVVPPQPWWVQQPAHPAFGGATSVFSQPPAPLQPPVLFTYNEADGQRLEQKDLYLQKSREFYELEKEIRRELEILKQGCEKFGTNFENTIQTIKQWREILNNEQHVESEIDKGIFYLKKVIPLLESRDKEFEALKAHGPMLKQRLERYNSIYNELRGLQKILGQYYVMPGLNTEFGQEIRERESNLGDFERLVDEYRRLNAQNILQQYEELKQRMEQPQSSAPQVLFGFLPPPRLPVQTQPTVPVAPPKYAPPSGNPYSQPQYQAPPEPVVPPTSWRTPMLQQALAPPQLPRPTEPGEEGEEQVGEWQKQHQEAEQRVRLEELRKQQELTAFLTRLNRTGDDQDLNKNGKDRQYWYSMRDGLVLARYIRLERLEQEEATVQNNRRVFLADPYHLENFESSLENDIKTITGTHEQDVHGQDHRAINTIWQQMPRLLIIPFLAGVHWRVIRVEIDYTNKRISILWDDPFGQNSFDENIKIKLKEIIRNQAQILLRTQTHEREILLIEDRFVDEYTKGIDQQGSSASDCGPIVFGNIADYVDVNKQNVGFAACVDEHYSITKADVSGHEDQMVDFRANHIIMFREVINQDPGEEDKDTIKDKILASGQQYTASWSQPQPVQQQQQQLVPVGPPRMAGLPAQPDPEGEFLSRPPRWAQKAVNQESVPDYVLNAENMHSRVIQWLNKEGYGEPSEDSMREVKNWLMSLRPIHRCGSSTLQSIVNTGGLLSRAVLDNMFKSSPLMSSLVMGHSNVLRHLTRENLDAAQEYVEASVAFNLLVIESERKEDPSIGVNRRPKSIVPSDLVVAQEKVKKAGKSFIPNMVMRHPDVIKYLTKKNLDAAKGYVNAFVELNNLDLQLARLSERALKHKTNMKAGQKKLESAKQAIHAATIQYNRALSKLNEEEGTDPRRFQEKLRIAEQNVSMKNQSYIYSQFTLTRQCEEVNKDKAELEAVQEKLRIAKQKVDETNKSLIPNLVQPIEVAIKEIVQDVEGMAEEIIKDALFNFENAEKGEAAGGKGAHFDKVMRTARQVFAVLGPHDNTSLYGGITLVLEEVLNHPDGYVLPCAASLFWSGMHGDGQGSVGRPWVVEVKGKWCDATRAELCRSRLHPMAPMFWDALAAEIIARTFVAPVEEKKAAAAAKAATAAAVTAEVEKRKGKCPEISLRDVQAWWDKQDPHALPEVHMPPIVPLGYISAVVGTEAELGLKEMDILNNALNPNVIHREKDERTSLEKARSLCERQPPTQFGLSFSLWPESQSIMLPIKFPTDKEFNFCFSSRGNFEMYLQSGLDDTSSTYVLQVQNNEALLRGRVKGDGTKEYEHLSELVTLPSGSENYNISYNPVNGALKVEARSHERTTPIADIITDTNKPMKWVAVRASEGHVSFRSLGISEQPVPAQVRPPSPTTRNLLDVFMRALCESIERNELIINKEKHERFLETFDFNSWQRGGNIVGRRRELRESLKTLLINLLEHKKLRGIDYWKIIKEMQDVGSVKKKNYINDKIRDEQNWLRLSEFRVLATYFGIDVTYIDLREERHSLVDKKTLIRKRPKGQTENCGVILREVAPGEFNVEIRHPGAPGHADVGAAPGPNPGHGRGASVNGFPEGEGVDPREYITRVLAGAEALADIPVGTYRTLLLRVLQAAEDTRRWIVMCNPKIPEPALVVTDTEQGKTLVFAQQRERLMDMLIQSLPEDVQRLIVQEEIRHEQIELAILEARIQEPEARVGMDRQAWMEFKGLIPDEEIPILVADIQRGGIQTPQDAHERALTYANSTYKQVLVGIKRLQEHVNKARERERQESLRVCNGAIKELVSLAQNMLPQSPQKELEQDDVPLTSPSRPAPLTLVQEQERNRELENLKTQITEVERDFERIRTNIKAKLSELCEGRISKANIIEPGLVSVDIKVKELIRGIKEFKKRCVGESLERKINKCLKQLHDIKNELILISSCLNIAEEERLRRKSEREIEQEQLRELKEIEQQLDDAIEQARDDRERLLRLKQQLEPVLRELEGDLNEQNLVEARKKMALLNTSRACEDIENKTQDLMLLQNNFNSLIGVLEVINEQLTGMKQECFRSYIIRRKYEDIELKLQREKNKYENKLEEIQESLEWYKTLPKEVLKFKEQLEELEENIEVLAVPTESRRVQTPQSVSVQRTYSLIETFVKVLCEGITQNLFILDLNIHERFLELPAFKQVTPQLTYNLADNIKYKAALTGQGYQQYVKGKILRRGLFDDWARAVTERDLKARTQTLRPVLLELVNDLLNPRSKKFSGIDYQAQLSPDEATTLRGNIRKVDENSKALFKALAMYFGINITYNGNQLVPEKILGKKRPKGVRRNFRAILIEEYTDQVRVEIPIQDVRAKHESRPVGVIDPEDAGAAPAPGPGQRSSFLGFPEQEEKLERPEEFVNRIFDGAEKLMDVSLLGAGVQLLVNIVKKAGWIVRYNSTETEPALVVKDDTLMFTQGMRQAMDRVFSLLPDKELQERIIRSVINHEQKEKGFLAQGYTHRKAHEKAMKQDSEECKMFRELIEITKGLSPEGTVPGTLDQLREIWRQVEQGTIILNRLRERNGMERINATKLLEEFPELLVAMNNYEGEIEENEERYFEMYEKVIKTYKGTRKGTQKIEVITDQGRAVVVWKLYDYSDKLIDVAILETIGDGVSMKLMSKVVMSIAKDFSNVTPDFIQTLEKMIGKIEQQFFAREQDLQGFKQLGRMLTAV